MLNTFVSAGVRLLLTGLTIVAAIIAAGGEKPARSRLVPAVDLATALFESTRRRAPLTQVGIYEVSAFICASSSASVRPPGVWPPLLIQELSAIA
jgi:hypothetical protein